MSEAIRRWYNVGRDSSEVASLPLRALQGCTRGEDRPMRNGGTLADTCSLWNHGSIASSSLREISRLSSQHWGQRISGDDRVRVGGAGTDVIWFQIGIVVQDGLRRHPLRSANSVSAPRTRACRGQWAPPKTSGRAVMRLEELGIGRHVPPLLWPLTPLLPNRIAGVYWVVECLRLDVFV